MLAYKISFKNRSVGYKLFHADGQMTKQIVAFASFAEPPKINQPDHKYHRSESLSA